ncbi:MAG: hypothetical protein Q8R55_06870 [Candidatus Taylorbacteria bacterium]|nr:hypothetical protein [Candidatus Taylorbacteria bacterium]
MAKFLIKSSARELRKQGGSIKDIARILSVSQSTASLWCRDIKLSKKQINRLLKSKGNNITRGRLRGAQIQREKRINAIKLAVKEAKKLKKLTNNEYFIAGLALYLAEGSKKMDRAQFTNTNPAVIKFMLKWFSKFYNVSRENIKYTILINKIHKDRDMELKRFWQKYLKLKPESFTNIRYIKTRQKKVYSNHDNYYGTFSFRINKSTHLLYKLNALTTRLLSSV